MIKSILFFKGFIGPYLRGGKMVNLKGYHSKQTKRVTASEGQSSLFGDLTAPPEVKQTAKVSRALSTWMQRHGGPAGMARLLADMSPEHQEKLVDAMAAIGKTDSATVRGMLGTGGTAAPAPVEPDLFSEPQHTEPTRELIEEHERLVDVLNSPSHEDDKVEAKKQAEELAEMKQEAAAATAPTKAQQTRARRKAVLDVLGEGWKADAGVDGAKDKYSKVFPKAEGGKLEVTIMPEKTVDGNFYVGSYHRGGTRRGAGSNGYAQTIEEAKSMAERFAGVSVEAKQADPEAELRAMWTKQGVSKERQDALIAQISGKAAPGAKVGPFTVPGGDESKAEKLPFSDGTQTPPESGVYQLRDGKFARFDHGIWWRRMNTPKEALLTESASTGTMKPETRDSDEDGWVLHAKISKRDAFGEPAGMSRAKVVANDAKSALIDHIKYLGGERKKDLLELAAHIDDFGYSNSVPDNVHIPVKNAAAAINHITRTSRISTEHGLAARKLTGAKARKLLADVAAAGGLGSLQDHIDAFHRIMGGSTMTKSIVFLRHPS